MNECMGWRGKVCSWEMLCRGWADTERFRRKTRRRGALKSKRVCRLVEWNGLVQRMEG